MFDIISYQEKLGNYNSTLTPLLMRKIISYQEKLGNYNCKFNNHSLKLYYIIPRKIRELQLIPCVTFCAPIISYQEKLGNYNPIVSAFLEHIIISYQEKLGNYNPSHSSIVIAIIISYQEKLGHYNNPSISVCVCRLCHINSNTVKPHKSQCYFIFITVFQTPRSCRLRLCASFQAAPSAR